jgi:hypothetical protein
MESKVSNPSVTVNGATITSWEYDSTTKVDFIKIFRDYFVVTCIEESQPTNPNTIQHSMELLIQKKNILDSFL